ncbi:hypothetical protein COF75_28665 [Bacillus toyonensis]|uniref:hypothetical protein n=1 Tax=Bacillus toyonensis TaxID=155322 RepID=UPI000BF16759|nr:hypothetical protein [Bacillus toyonensis]PEK90841.1 hypothetical protein CN594_01695 [Bacillus toyonensis]PFY32611.1 hypothetical protein COL54_31665 [Bacillus toyonensis]PGD10950.1 hypothetical protein COM37_29805 [Bacillus toyonensis]PHD37332.1 hypothetical protein COF75_28665 [Bacillus toyonensis]
MDIRKAYEIVIRNQLEKLIADGCLYLSNDQVNKLAHSLSYNYSFLEELNIFVQDHLEVNGYEIAYDFFPMNRNKKN